MFYCSKNISIFPYSHTVQCSSTVFPLCLKHSVWASVSLRSSLTYTQSLLIGQLTHAWLRSTNRPAALNQFPCAKPAARHALCKCMTRWRSVMSQSLRVKIRTTNEAFQEQCFLWERGAPVGAKVDHFNFQDLVCAQELRITEGKEQKAKA